MRIGLQRDRAMDACPLQQKPGAQRVGNRRKHREYDAEPNLLQWLRIHQSRHRSDDDRNRRNENQAPFNTAGKIFGLFVAEIVIVIGAGGDVMQCPQSHNRGGEIDQRFNRV